MRKAAVSLAAMIVMLAAFALPTNSAPRDYTFARGTNYEISLNGLPDNVAAGQAISGSISIYIYPDAAPGRRALVSHETSIVNAQTLEVVGFSHRGAAQIPVGRTKMLRKSFTVPRNAPAMTIGVILESSVLGESLSVGKFINVTK